MTPHALTLPIERARSRRPITWLTIVGVLLLPVVIGGILVAALYNPVERLDSLTAAIVNDDEPVMIDGQTVPLGRQLTAGLIEGSDELDSNLAWTISNSDDAASGLADGTYAAVITIPENFSAAATSTQPGEVPEQATIEVQTPPDSLIVDDAITAQVANAAASTMGSELSSVYLENVLLGFTTLGDELGTAADGASQLADGAQQAADGASALPGGIAQLGDGAGQLSTGATELAGGLDQIAGGIGDAASGARDLGAGLDAAAAGVQNQQLLDAANASSMYAGDAARQTEALALLLGNPDQNNPGLAQKLGALHAQCDPSVSGKSFCDQLGALAGGLGTAAEDAGTAAVSAGTAAGYAAPTASGIGSLMTETSGGLVGAANGARELASGLDQLQGATNQSADGTRQLSSGASQLASGATQAADGATTLADGVAQLAGGTGELANGLATASDSIPSYTDSEATDLATVVADPVAAQGVGTSLFGASAVPLLAMLALWFGGLGTFIALQAVSRRALTSRAPSAVLALRSFLPAAGLGVAQGLLVAGVVQLAASYSWADWSGFAAVCVVAGVAFAAVNQALVAVFGGAGRWIAALVGVLAVATGVVSTAPGVLSDIAGLMPTAPAYEGMVAALTSASGIGGAFAGLMLWSLAALAATVLAVARRRTISGRALLTAVPATA
ncbi:YhgE/Pip family protein [Microbacterium sp. HD4P20]|uniref:YhgE/Pip family protein n=1 Tax=Microbacterium sp. HD4P20 TaxID=2864874 RepID=UPI001C641D69|nr:YhgE/Pip family protein [Microbacterium sp. HD4P20]MCP2636241.1 YhgE/Pip family protein [Microbacterium sp. HD4P20]